MRMKTWIQPEVDSLSVDKEVWTQLKYDVKTRNEPGPHWWNLSAFIAGPIKNRLELELQPL